MSALALGGCALLVAAALSFRSDQSAVSAQLPTPTRTPPAITSVPTFIPSETPTPTETPSATPTRSATPSPTASATPATPSRTPTRTRQPTGGTAPTSRPPTATLTATSPPAVVSGGGSRGVTGQLSLCNPKPSYAAKSDTFIGERICVNELITNTTDQTIPYGILGVNAENLSGGASAFQTSWRGDLSLPPHGNGPGGGNWQDGLYLDVGTYSLTLSICYSDVDTCLGSGGEWETLTPGITINVVAWTP